jgi:ABC-type transport system involved in cytochrome c biogenesis permease subunit
MTSEEMYLMAFLSSFTYVGLKSFQQLNVAHKKYWMILPISCMMALLEVWSVTVMAKHGISWLVLFIGVGGGLGSILATYLHDKFLMEKSNED